MPNQLLKNAVLYSPSPNAGSRYRQIVVMVLEGQPVTRIFDGDVILNEGEIFKAVNDLADYTTFPTLDAAYADARDEEAKSITERWQLYRGTYS